MLKLQKELKQRYGLSLDPNVYIIQDRKYEMDDNNQYEQQDSIVFKWGVIPPNDVGDRMIEIIDTEELGCEDLNDIYKKSKSGWNSDFNPINKDYRKKIEKFKEENSELKKKNPNEYHQKEWEIQTSEFTQLIPCVLISYKDGRNLSKKEREINRECGEMNSKGEITFSFRVDNPLIREMFFDTQCLMSNNSGDGISEELQEGMDKRLKEHKEYLDYFFSGKGWIWIKLWFEKCGITLNTSGENHKHLLHSEYLEQVLNKTLEEYHNEEQDRINSEMKEKGLDVNNIKTNDELVELDEIIRNGDE